MNSKLFNIEAECDILGAMIESTSARNEILNILTEDDFYEKNGANQLVYRAIDKLVKDSAVVDIASITTELGVNMKCLERVGGVPYLINLQERYVGDRNAIYHAQSLKDLSSARKLYFCLKDCYDGLENDKFDDIGQYIAQCEDRILEITKARRVSEFESAGDIVQKITDELRLLKGKPKNRDSISTGFSTLDNYIAMGWKPGQFNIIGARPSVGKTAFALNLAYNAAQTSGRTVAFFSLEMDAKSIVQRMLSMVSQVSSDAMIYNKLEDNDWLALDNAVDALKRCKLWIDDTPGEKLTDIRTKAFKLKAQNPDLCAIFIDYLGLITTNIKNDRQNEVAEISRQLKALARELEVPIICLSQLSRDSAKKTGNESIPKLTDLRDSGAIEQDADIVFFLHRMGYQKNDLEKENNKPLEIDDAKVIVSKNRNGKTGMLDFQMLMSYGKFVEVAKREDE